MSRFDTSVWAVVPSVDQQKAADLKGIKDVAGGVRREGKRTKKDKGKQPGLKANGFVESTRESFAKRIPMRPQGGSGDFRCVLHERKGEKGKERGRNVELIVSSLRR